MDPILLSIRELTCRSIGDVRAAVLCMILLLSGAREMRACPHGYESPEALVKRARLIVELEVLSTRDAVAQPTNNRADLFLREDDAGERSNAVAEVKVVRCLKGLRPAARFTLIGGPYDSCAPYYSYLRFKPGERVLLLLDHELPREVKAVLVNWRCRVLGAENSEIGVLMQNARKAWRRDVERYRMVAPNEFARATTLTSSPGVLNPGVNLLDEPYAVLCSLRTLWSDPDRLPPVLLETSAVPPDGVDATGKLVNGVYHTGQKDDHLLPGVLAHALDRCAKTRAKEVITFNRKLFQSVLSDELVLTDHEIKRIMTALNSHDRFASPWFNPYRCDTSMAKSADPAVADLRFALGLADDEPDRLVWTTFGLGMTTNEIVPFFADYVQRNPNRNYHAWPRLIVLLRGPHPKTSVAVRTCLGKETNQVRLRFYFEYFLKLKDRAEALVVLDKFEQISARETKARRSKPEIQEFKEHQARNLEELAKLATRLAAGDAEINSRLRGLARDRSR